MRISGGRWKLGVAAIAVLAVGTGAYAIAGNEHPDSKTQPLDDGCNRSQLALLGEAALTMEAGPHPSGFSSWVYVDGDNSMKTLEGEVLGTHTAGTDLFGVHDTYDLNIDVKPDPAYEHLLSTRNAEEEPAPIGQIHTEWESGLAPLFAWPSPGDRVRESGSEIWDCGHWQDGDRKVPEGDFIPGDPLGTAGAEEIGGEEIEIHPIAELATWRKSGAFVPGSASVPVNATQLDVAISNQGGKAKGVEECALVAPAHPTAIADHVATGQGCSTLQTVAGRDYTYRLDAPGPAPSSASQLLVQQDVHYSHNGPDTTAVRAVVNGDHVDITVPFSSVAPSTEVQDFGATWHAWWSDDAAAPHRFLVRVTGLHIHNNLESDAGDDSANPSITPEGEWNMYVDRSGQWTNLHDPREGQVDYVPALGSVPSAKDGAVALDVGSVPPAIVVLPDDGALHLFVDARECDQPGYVDCPTNNELAATGKSAGRAEISLPVSQLVGTDTTVVIHPPICAPNTPCPEEKNPQSLCGDTGCYDVTFDVTEIADPAVATPVAVVMVAGDGTGAGTLVDGHPAGSLPWWIEPETSYAVDEGEENVVVARVIELMRQNR